MLYNTCVSKPNIVIINTLHDAVFQFFMWHIDLTLCPVRYFQISQFLIIYYNSDQSHHQIGGCLQAIFKATSTFDILYCSSERHKLNFILEQAKKAQSMARGINPLFLWSQHARWRWVDNATLRPLHPRKEIWYPFYKKLRGAKFCFGRVWKFEPPPGFDPWIVQPVASSYTNWAIPAQWKKKWTKIIKWILQKFLWL